MDIVTTTPYVVSLADVAALAHVERPVVSMWRRRGCAAGAFPSVVARHGGEDYVDAESLRAWLSTSGRGNSADVEDDLATYAVPRGLLEQPGSFTVDVLTSVICLHALASDALTAGTPSEILQAAQEVDPRDEFLLGEVRAAGDSLRQVVDLTERIVGSSYSIAAALDWVVDHPRRYGPDGPAALRFTNSAQSLITTLAWACRPDDVDAGWVDTTYGGSDVAVALVDSAGWASSEPDLSILSSERADAVTRAAARLTARRLRVRGVVPAILGEGPLSEETPPTGNPVTYLALVPPPGAPSTGMGALDAIDQVILRMSDHDRGLVIGPSSVLIDHLRDSGVRARRSDLLRDGCVRVMIRLPHGMVAAAPRQGWAAWVLGARQTDVAIRDRRVSVANLSDLSLDEMDASAVGDDLVAALGDARSVRAHAFGYAHVVPTARLIADSSALVPAVTGPRTRASVDPTLAVDVAMLAARTRPALPGAPIPEIHAVASPRTLPVTTLGDLERGERLKVLAGHRLGRLAFTSTGSPVVGVQDLLDPETPQRYVDLLAFTSAFHRIRRSESGDVIFCAGPRPAARVDVRGGTVVEYPARILRFTDPVRDGVVPDIVAADISRQPSVSRSWRAWPARTVRAEQVPAVSAALDILREARRTTAARLADLDGLAALLADGATSGSLRVDMYQANDPFQNPENTREGD